MMEETQTDHLIRISVVIPAYNKGRWIGRAIESVLAQTRPAEEIIVVDDGSTDQTPRVIQNYGEKLRYIRQENAGPSAARNAGIQAATGNWIAFLDADDEWVPRKLELQIEHLQRNPQLRWTTANYYHCLCHTHRCRPANPVLTPGVEVLEDFIPAYGRGFTGCTDTKLIQRDLLLDAGGFPVEQRGLEDLDLWLRIAYREPRIGYLSVPLAIYHLQTGQQNVSITYRSGQTCLELLDRHLSLSAKWERDEAFRALAGILLRRWMRGLLFYAEHAGEVRKMADHFSDLLSRKDRVLFRVLSAFPKITECVLRTISKFVQITGLRKRAQRPPVRSEKNDQPEIG